LQDFISLQGAKSSKSFTTTPPFLVAFAIRFFESSILSQVVLVLLVIFLLIP
jgi:hypothetical protein